ncbi:hypothetical protein BH09PLA1_BH09PLA1_04680 [soil metagenome]
MTDQTHATTPPNDAPHADHVRSLLFIYIWLMMLLAATVLAALLPAFHVGDFNIVIAMAIAITKAALVIWFFMHVKYGGKLVWIFATAAFVWLGIMLILTFSDYMTRSRLPRAADQVDTMNIRAPEHSERKNHSPQPRG